MAVHLRVSDPVSTNPFWQEKAHVEPKVKSPWRWEQFRSPQSGALRTGQVVAAEVQTHSKQEPVDCKAELLGPRGWGVTRMFPKISDTLRSSRSATFTA